MSLYPIGLFYESIQNEQYFQIGSFKKPIGVDGGLIASFLYPLNYAELVKLPALFVEIEHKKVPYCIKHVISVGSKMIIHLALIQSKTEAYAFRNLPIFLPIALKSRWLEAMLPYSLVNGLVEEVILGQLGSIQAIYCARDQYIMAVDYREKELLIPYCKPFLIEVNVIDKKVRVQLPEGYIKTML